MVKRLQGRDYQHRRKANLFPPSETMTDVRQEEQLSFVVDYGRSDLLIPRSRATESDKPIKSQETKTFVLSARQVEQWIDNVTRLAHSDARRAWLVIDMINFGDGTGFVGNVPFQIGETG